MCCVNLRWKFLYFIGSGQVYKLQRHSMLSLWQKNSLHWTKLLLNGLLLQPAAKQLKTASLRIFKQKFIVVNWCSRCNRHFFSHVNNRNEIAQVLNYSRGTWNSGTHVITGPAAGLQPLSPELTASIPSVPNLVGKNI